MSGIYVIMIIVWERTIYPAVWRTVMCLLNDAFWSFSSALASDWSSATAGGDGRRRHDVGRRFARSCSSTHSIVRTIGRLRGNYEKVVANLILDPSLPSPYIFYCTVDCTCSFPVGYVYLRQTYGFLRFTSGEATFTYGGLTADLRSIASYIVLGKKTYSILRRKVSDPWSCSAPLIID